MVVMTKVNLKDSTYDKIEMFLINRHFDDVHKILNDYSYEELLHFYEREVRGKGGGIHGQRGSVINIGEAREIRYDYIDNLDRQLERLEYLESQSEHSADDYDEMDHLEEYIRYIENYILELNKLKDNKKNEDILFYLIENNSNPRISLLDKEALIEIFSAQFGARF